MKYLVEIWSDEHKNNCPKHIKFTRCLVSVSKRWALIAPWNSAVRRLKDLVNKRYMSTIHKFEILFARLGVREMKKISLSDK